jgi:hypothetical protein
MRSLGLGHLAQVAVLPALKRCPNSKLVALISGDPKKQERVAEKYGVDKVYSYELYEECLSNGVFAEIDFLLWFLWSSFWGKQLKRCSTQSQTLPANGDHSNWSPTAKQSSR